MEQIQDQIQRTLQGAGLIAILGRPPPSSKCVLKMFFSYDLTLANERAELFDYVLSKIRIGAKIYFVTVNNYGVVHYDPADLKEPQVAVSTSAFIQLISGAIEKLREAGFLVTEGPRAEGQLCISGTFVAENSSDEDDGSIEYAQGLLVEAIKNHLKPESPLNISAASGTYYIGYYEADKLHSSEM